MTFNIRKADGTFQKVDFIFCREARTGVDINGIIPDNQFRIFPFVQVLKTITAHDNGEFVFGKFFSEIGEGVDGI